MQMMFKEMREETWSISGVKLGACKKSICSQSDVIQFFFRLKLQAVVPSLHNSDEGLPFPLEVQDQTKSGL